MSRLLEALKQLEQSASSPQALEPFSRAELTEVEEQLDRVRRSQQDDVAEQRETSANSAETEAAEFPPEQETVGRQVVDASPDPPNELEGPPAPGESAAVTLAPGHRSEEAANVATRHQSADRSPSDGLESVTAAESHDSAGRSADQPATEPRASSLPQASPESAAATVDPPATVSELWAAGSVAGDAPKTTGSAAAAEEEAYGTLARKILADLSGQFPHAVALLGVDEASTQAIDIPPLVRALVNELGGSLLLVEGANCRWLEALGAADKLARSGNQPTPAGLGRSGDELVGRSGDQPTAQLDGTTVQLDGTTAQLDGTTAVVVGGSPDPPTSREAFPEPDPAGWDLARHATPCSVEGVKLLQLDEAAEVNPLLLAQGKRLYRLVVAVADAESAHGLALAKQSDAVYLLTALGHSERERARYEADRLRRMQLRLRGGIAVRCA